MFLTLSAYNARRGQSKCDGTRTETRFRLSAKLTSPFKSAGASVQSTTGSRGVRISCSNAGYTMSRGSVKSTGYSLSSPISPSLPQPALPCAITFQLESSCRQGLVSLPSLRWRATWQLICSGYETFVDRSIASVLSLPLNGCRHLRLFYFSTRGASGQGRVVQFCVQTAQQFEM